GHAAGLGLVEDLRQLAPRAGRLGVAGPGSGGAPPRRRPGRGRRPGVLVRRVAARAVEALRQRVADRQLHRPAGNPEGKRLRPDDPGLGDTSGAGRRVVALWTLLGVAGAWWSLARRDP